MTKVFMILAVIVASSSAFAAGDKSEMVALLGGAEMSVQSVVTAIDMRSKPTVVCYRLGNAFSSVQLAAGYMIASGAPGASELINRIPSLPGYCGDMAATTPLVQPVRPGDTNTLFNQLVLLRERIQMIKTQL